MRSLHSHRLRQIARLIHVSALLDRCEIGQQLHRDGVDQRGDQGMALGGIDAADADLAREILGEAAFDTVQHRPSTAFNFVLVVLAIMVGVVLAAALVAAKYVR